MLWMTSELRGFSKAAQSARLVTGPESNDLHRVAPWIVDPNELARAAKTKDMRGNVDDEDSEMRDQNDEAHRSSRLPTAVKSTQEEIDERNIL